MSFCIACGNKNLANAKFCYKCGSTIAAASEPSSAGRAAALQNAIHLFIGPNSKYYMTRWSEKERPVSRINMAALLSGPIWFAYRKMYLYAFIYIVALGALTCLSVWPSPPLSLVALIAVIIIMLGGFSLLANKLYKKHAEAAITAVIKPSSQRSQLTNRGIFGGAALIAAIALVSNLHNLHLLLMFVLGPVILIALVVSVLSLYQTFVQPHIAKLLSDPQSPELKVIHRGGVSVAAAVLSLIFLITMPSVLTGVVEGMFHIDLGDPCARKPELWICFAIVP